MFDRQVGSASCANGNKNQNVVICLGATRLVTTITSINTVKVINLDIESASRWGPKTDFFANACEEVVYCSPISSPFSS